MKAIYVLAALHAASGLQLKQQETAFKGGISTLIELVRELLKENRDTFGKETKQFDKYGCDSTTLMEDTNTKIVNNRNTERNENQKAMLEDGKSAAAASTIKTQNEILANEEAARKTLNENYQSATAKKTKEENDFNSEINALAQARKAIVDKNAIPALERKYEHFGFAGHLQKRNCLCQGTEIPTNSGLKQECPVNAKTGFFRPDATKKILSVADCGFEECSKKYQICYDPTEATGPDNQRMRGFGNAKQHDDLQNLPEAPELALLQLASEDVKSVIQKSISIAESQDVPLNDKEIKAMKSFLQSKTGKVGQGGALQVVGVINGLIQSLVANIDKGVMVWRSQTSTYNAQMETSNQATRDATNARTDAQLLKQKADDARNLAHDKAQAAKKIKEDSDAVLAIMLDQVKDSTLAWDQRKSMLTMEYTQMSNVLNNPTEGLLHMQNAAMRSREDSGAVSFLQMGAGSKAQRAARVIQGLGKYALKEDGKKVLGNIAMLLQEPDAKMSTRDYDDLTGNDVSSASTSTTSLFAPVITTIEGLLDNLASDMTEDKKNQKMCIKNIVTLEDSLSLSISDGDKARTQYEQAVGEAAAANQNKLDAEAQKKKTQEEKTKYTNDYNDAKNVRNEARKLDQGVLEQYQQILSLVSNLQNSLAKQSKDFMKSATANETTSYGNSGQATQQGSTTAQYTGNKGLTLIKDLVDNLIQETNNDIKAGNKADKKLKTQFITVTSKQQNEIDQQQQIESDEDGGQTKANNEAMTQEMKTQAEFGTNDGLNSPGGAATNFNFNECSAGKDASGKACQESHSLISLKAHCKNQIDGLPERIIKRQHEMDGLNTAINILKGMTA